jgi:hypothetical protein
MGETEQRKKSGMKRKERIGSKETDLNNVEGLRSEQ